MWKTYIDIGPDLTLHPAGSREHQVCFPEKGTWIPGANPQVSELVVLIGMVWDVGVFCMWIGDWVLSEVSISANGKY